MRTRSIIALLAILAALMGAGWKWSGDTHSSKQAGWTWDDSAAAEVWYDD